MENRSRWWEDYSSMIKIIAAVGTIVMACLGKLDPREAVIVLLALAGIAVSAAQSSGAGGTVKAGKKLLGVVFVAGALGLGLSGCAGQQSQEQGIKAAKCLADCAIKCGLSGALSVTTCNDYSEEALKQQGIAAAQCLAACSIGCGLKATTVAGPATPAIAHGHEAASKYPSVGTVHLRSQRSVCTGFLVSPRHALTAAHCAERAPYQIDFDGKSIGITRWAMHPMFAVSPRYDLAVLHLEKEVDIPPLKWRGYGPHEGEIVTLIGAGISLPGKIATAGKIREGAAVVCRSDSYLYEFAGTRGICQGDSGGPALAGGQVVGIHFAMRGNDCGAAGLGIKLSIHAGWVESITGHAL